MNILTRSTLINSLIFFSGVGTCGSAYFFAFNDKIVGLLLGVGSSIIASSIVAGLANIYWSDIQEAQSIIDEWGLKNIYKYRSQKNVYINKLIKSSSEMDICAYGLNALRDNMSEIITNKVRNGFKLRIITYDPNGDFVKYREKELGEKRGAIARSIINCRDWVNELREIAPDQNNVQILLSDGMHLNYYQRVDSDIFIGPYLPGKSGQQTITYHFRKYGRGYEYYIQTFDWLWRRLLEVQHAE